MSLRILNVGSSVLNLAFFRETHDSNDPHVIFVSKFRLKSKKQGGETHKFIYLSKAAASRGGHAVAVGAVARARAPCAGARKSRCTSHGAASCSPSVPPPAAAVDLVAGGEPFSFSGVSFETPREGEGLPSAASAPLRRRGDTSLRRVWAWYRGCSSSRSFAVWWPVWLAAALVLLCLLVAVVGAIDRRFEALVGRIAVLEEVLASGGDVVYCGG